MIAISKSLFVSGVPYKPGAPPITRSAPCSANDFINDYIDKGYRAYRPKTYKITFVDKIASTTPAPIYVIANVPYSAGNGLPVQSVSGYHFLGWYTAASGGVKVPNNDCSGMSARTLYAHYKYTGNISPTSNGAYDCIIPQTVRPAENEIR